MRFHTKLFVFFNCFAPRQSSELSQLAAFLHWYLLFSFKCNSFVAKSRPAGLGFCKTRTDIQTYYVSWSCPLDMYDNVCHDSRASGHFSIHGVPKVITWSISSICVTCDFLKSSRSYTVAPLYLYHEWFPFSFPIAYTEHISVALYANPAALFPQVLFSGCASKPILIVSHFRVRICRCEHSVELQWVLTWMLQVTTQTLTWRTCTSGRKVYHIYIEREREIERIYIYIYIYIIYIYIYIYILSIYFLFPYSMTLPTHKQRLLGQVLQP
jgi:hypothetical protein